MGLAEVLEFQGLKDTRKGPEDVVGLKYVLGLRGGSGVAEGHELKERRKDLSEVRLKCFSCRSSVTVGNGQ